MSGSINQRECAPRNSALRLAAILPADALAPSLCSPLAPAFGGSLRSGHTTLWLPNAEGQMTSQLLFVPFRDAANAAFRVWAFGETQGGANGELTRVELAR